MDKVGALGGAWSPLDDAGQHKTKRQTRSRLSIHETIDRSTILCRERELVIDCLTSIVKAAIAPVTTRVIAPVGVKRVSRRGERTESGKRGANIMTISGTSIAKVTICILLGCCVTMRVTGSAIPMWEFLSRNEKMSHLYGLFSKQVARFCADSSRPDCNKNLLVTGIRSLASMDDNVLDRLDPYQRGAKEIIWHAMVGSNRFASRISHENDDSYFTTETDLLASSGSETNGLGEETAVSGDYVQSSESSGPYLAGPMVIRVYPDGRPVPEDQKRPLPKDEDADELRYSRLPSIEEIETKSGSMFYGKGANEPSMAKRRLAFAIDDKDYRRPEAMRLRDHSLPYERAVFRGALNERRVRYY